MEIEKGHFDRLVDAAFGGVFGLIEYQARRSAIPIGYREDFYPLVQNVQAQHQLSDHRGNQLDQLFR